MFSRLFMIMKLLLGAILICLLTLWGVRAYNAWQAPPLQLWHTFVPQEMTIREMEQATWADYLKQEDQIFASVRAHVTEKLPENARANSNRFYENSPIYPPNFEHNWNRSYTVEPVDGQVKGAVVFLHGLTDAPYSLRHLAREYAKNGFVAYGLRIPAHGTVPGALTSVTWEHWQAATNMAMRAAKSRIQDDQPLHIIGFSNGGALAMKYALDSLENPALAKPHRVVLISPMIGITRFARFAGLAGVPAILPPFAKTAWLGIVPEFNPFKYNSFPVNGARQSHRLTTALQEQISKLATSDSFNNLPPVLTFQSVMDYTVSTSAIITSLYNQLPENGSELVLFDINRATFLGPVMRSASEAALQRILPTLPQNYTITLVANREIGLTTTETRTTPAGKTASIITPLDLEYPPHIFSLSHVAIPFPMDDPLYGMNPPPGSDQKFGVNLGTISARGERGALSINLDSLFRTTSNPFFPFLLDKVVEGVLDPMPAKIAGKPAPKLGDIEENEVYKRELEEYSKEYNEDAAYTTP